MPSGSVWTAADDAAADTSQRRDRGSDSHWNSCPRKFHISLTVRCYLWNSSTSVCVLCASSVRKTLVSVQWSSVKVNTQANYCMRALDVSIPPTLLRPAQHCPSSLVLTVDGTERANSCFISALPACAVLRQLDSSDAATVGSSNSPATTTSLSRSDTSLALRSKPT
jgi:hypothetical protein